MLEFGFGLEDVTPAGTPLPEGTYQFLLEDLKAAPAKDGSSHNLKMKLTVTSAEENGRTQLENLNVQKSTLPFVKAWLMAMLNQTADECVGFYPTVDEDGTVSSINGEEVIGREVFGTVKHKDGYGNIIGWAPVPF